MDELRRRRGHVHLAILPLKAVGPGDAAILLVGDPSDDAIAGRIELGDGLARSWIEAGNFKLKGRGDPHRAVAEGYAAGVCGVGLGFKEGLAAFVVEFVDLEVHLVDAPEAVGRGLQAVGLGSGAFETLFNAGDLDGHRMLSLLGVGISNPQMDADGRRMVAIEWFRV